MDGTEAAKLAERDRLAAAVSLAERFLGNIESVVHGKREEIKLVLTALLCP